MTKPYVVTYNPGGCCCGEGHDAMYEDYNDQGSYVTVDDYNKDTLALEEELGAANKQIEAILDFAHLLHPSGNPTTSSFSAFVARRIEGTLLEALTDCVLPARVSS